MIQNLKNRPNKGKDISWCGGLFEGEGCFYLHNRGEGRVRAYACLNMSDKDSVEEFHKAIGVGSIFGPYGDYRKRKDGSERLPQWRWYTTGPKAIEVMELLWDYLGNRRRNKIIEILESVEAYYAI